MRKYPSRIFSAVAAVGFMASLSACQVKPGEYRIYKIAAQAPTAQADCGFDIDPRDYSTFYGTQTIQVFATDPDEYFLERDTDVLVGTRDGTDYTFAGEAVEVNEPFDGATVTTTRKFDIILSIKGYKLTGEYVEFNSQVCAGDCAMLDDSACTISGTFTGSEIKDVDLERPI